MSSLFKRMYLMVLASLLLFALLAGTTFALFADWDRFDRSDRVINILADELLPPDMASAKLQPQLERWSEQLEMNLAVYQDVELIAGAGEPVSTPDAATFARAAAGERSWSHPGRKWQIVFPLAGGRALVAEPNRQSQSGERDRPGFVGLLTVLALIGLAVAIAVWPSARRLTRRLEQLQTSVDAFGNGDLSARAEIKGKDDFARLATHFNQSADRIAGLLRSQKSLLANASHELRSPLARIRMAVTLFNEPGLNAQSRQDASAELLRNVTELDELVDELLTASRLDASDAAVNPAGTGEPWESFDLGGLVAEECARLQISPALSSQEVFGERRLLRRLVRNLLENAQRYGRGSPDDEITVELAPTDEATPGHLRLSVCDRGPGIPADEAERIFEPFYRARGASEKSGGVGLGLSLVRQIAQHHKGTVRCEPRAGGGTCFRVLLPTDGDRRSEAGRND